MAKIKCRCCGGAGKTRGLGMIQRDCKMCEGAGKIESDSEVKEIVIKPLFDSANIAAMSDADAEKINELKNSTDASAVHEIKKFVSDAADVVLQDTATSFTDSAVQNVMTKRRGRPAKAKE